MIRIRAAAVLAAAFALVTPPAMAQTSVPNPLRPRPAEQKPAEQKPAEAPRAQSPRADRDEKPADDKPKRERSAKQKENDDIMRACGASWRAEKASLQSKGETWRSYLKECRAKKKTEVRA